MSTSFQHKLEGGLHLDVCFCLPDRSIDGGWGGGGVGGYKWGSWEEYGIL